MALSELNGWNVFWIDGDAVREHILEHPYVLDAEVHVSPLLARVDVDVVEVRPVALWVTEAGTLWIRDDGVALEPRGTTTPGLLQILDGPAEATAPGTVPGTAIDRQVLASAEGLANRLPGVAPVRFNRQIGLNFPVARKGLLGLLGRWRECGRKIGESGCRAAANRQWTGRRHNDRCALRTAVREVGQAWQFTVCNCFADRWLVCSQVSVAPHCW